MTLKSQSRIFVRAQKKRVTLLREFGSLGLGVWGYGRGRLTKIVQP